MGHGVLCPGDAVVEHARVADASGGQVVGDRGLEVARGRRGLRCVDGARGGPLCHHDVAEAAPHDGDRRRHHGDDGHPQPELPRNAERGGEDQAPGDGPDPASHRGLGG